MTMRALQLGTIATLVIGTSISLLATTLTARAAEADGWKALQHCGVLELVLADYMSPGPNQDAVRRTGDLFIKHAAAERGQAYSGYELETLKGEFRMLIEHSSYAQAKAHTETMTIKCKKIAELDGLLK